MSDEGQRNEWPMLEEFKSLERVNAISLSKTVSRRRACDYGTAVEVIVKRKMTMHTVDSEELATCCSAQRLQLSPTLFLVLGGSARVPLLLGAAC
jgi:hypothetical protein